MTQTTMTREDARDLLGMRDPKVLPILGAYILAMITVAVFQVDVVTSTLLLFTGLAVFIAAAICIVLASGDPLPPVWTVLLTLAGPVGCACVLAATPSIPLSSLIFTWVHGGGTAVYCFMNVRGRLIAPWLGLAGMVVVAALWAHSRGLSPVAAALLVGVDAATIVMSLMFALTLRPTAQRVFMLRRLTTARIAESAAGSAAADERAAQARRLNVLARPLLEVIASGAELTADERIRCEMLEAHLRDQLRAPLLARLGLDVAAYEARLRGVDVVLIDDTCVIGEPLNDSDLNPDVVAALRNRATSALSDADVGQVFVRVSAPDRPIAASILVRSDLDVARRSEIGPDGAVHDFE